MPFCLSIKSFSATPNLASSLLSLLLLKKIARYYCSYLHLFLVLQNRANFFTNFIKGEIIFSLDFLFIDFNFNLISVCQNNTSHMFSTPILYHTARKHVNGRIAKLSHQILCIFELIKTFMDLFSGKTLEKKL